MKINLDLGWVALLAAGYAAWYFYYHCIQHGDRVYIAQSPQPTIYPPIQAPPQTLPLYLPRPPLLPGPSNDTCGFPCGLFNPPNCQDGTPPPPCMALPLCVSGYVNNPKTCSCVPACEVVQKGSSFVCYPGTHWNWCAKGCVSDMSMMPDCPGPTCRA